MKSVWKMESTLIPNFSLQFRVVNDQGLVIKRRGAIFRIPHLQNYSKLLNYVKTLLQ